MSPLTRLLARWRYAVEAAATMQAALGKAAAGRSELLVSDISLPVGSGVELMNEFHAHGVNLRGVAIRASPWSATSSAARAPASPSISPSRWPAQQLRDAIAKVLATM